MNTEILFEESLLLLKTLISTESFSRHEDKTAQILLDSLHHKGIAADVYLNNVFTCNRHFDPALPTLLLNSHHDTVKPNSGWTYNPFEPVVEGNKLIGLGSNDAGASLVSLWAAFIALYEEKLPYNIILAMTAEEEIAGSNGIEALLPKLGPIDAGIVGEPTGMNMAIAEKGLMVLDCIAHGKGGHAARDIGSNAIYNALQDIEWFRTYQFPEESPMLGKIKMTVTQIEAGSQHNVIPDRCKFVVDVRITDKYSHEQVLNIVRQHIKSEVNARSMRLKPSGIAETHSLVQTANQLYIHTFGSPTMSDQALMKFPTVKMGPGLSERSHTSNEYIELSELKQGIEGYIRFLKELQSIPKLSGILLPIM
jgi:acetylornithine deacetylase